MICYLSDMVSNKIGLIAFGASVLHTDVKKILETSDPIQYPGLPQFIVVFHIVFTAN